MARRGRCRCGCMLRFERGPDGYKTRCSGCGAVVRLRRGNRQSTSKAIPVMCRCGAVIDSPGDDGPLLCPRCSEQLPAAEEVGSHAESDRANSGSSTTSFPNEVETRTSAAALGNRAVESGRPAAPADPLAARKALASLALPAKELVSCRVCQTRVPSAANFCPQCGICVNDAAPPALAEPQPLEVSLETIAVAPASPKRLRWGLLLAWLGVGVALIIGTAVVLYLVLRH
jgi:hypothetical protein